MLNQEASITPQGSVSTSGPLVGPKFGVREQASPEVVLDLQNEFPAAFKGLTTQGAELLANALLRRVPREQMANYLDPKIENLTPFEQLKGGKEFAKALFDDVILKGLSTVWFHDYDVDGTTAASQLMNTVRGFRARSQQDAVASRRFSVGYSVNTEMLDEAIAQGMQVAVLLDFGSKNAAEIEYLRSKGVKVYVVDHHDMGLHGEAPPAHHFINPMQSDCGFNGKHYCTSTLALRISQELLKLGREQIKDFPERDQKRIAKNLKDFKEGYLYFLAGIGAVQDVMPLQGDNRIIFREGAKFYNAADSHPVIKALKLGKQGDEHLLLTAEVVGYHFGPSINAAGRQDDRGAGKVVELFLAESFEEAESCEQILKGFNLERKRETRQVVIRTLEALKDRKPTHACVVAHAENHLGSVGVAASSMLAITRVPTFVLGQHSEEMWAGSGRTPPIPGVHLARALEDPRVKKWIAAGGGHAQAAGVKVPKVNLEKFSEALSQVIEEQTGGNLGVTRNADFSLTIPELRAIPAADWKQIRDVLSPVGNGNPGPSVLIPSADVASVRPVNEFRAYSLNLNLTDGGQLLPAVVWSVQPEAIKEGNKLSVVADIDVDKRKHPFNPKEWIVRATVADWKSLD